MPTTLPADSVPGRSRRGSGPPPAEVRAAVWVVDDSPLQRELCRRVLAPHYDVTLYSGGSAALEDLARHPAPQVLVLDWHMPDLSGVEVCRFVRTTRDMARLPILIVTANGSAESVLEALAAGANDFVQRPFFDAELTARVAALVSTSLLHAQLVEAEARLRVEAEFRERFMGMLAHDLRQPLNAIAMASGVLGQPGADAVKLSQFAGLQQRAALRMGRMIAELLDFTRNRPDSAMPLQLQSCNFEQIARASLDEIRVNHTDRSIDFTVHGACVGLWDADRLAQVCSNLFCNAIEHAPAGSHISVRLTGDAAGVELRVTNGGPPIPEHVLATLFQPFRRGHGSKGAQSGVGLGLHIVQQIVHAHDGTVEVESEPDATQFIVYLPFSAANS